MNTSEQTRSTETEPKNPFMVPGGEFPNMFAQTTQRFASAMASVSAEMMKFATRRFEAQAKAWDACASCTDFPSLTKLQGKLLADMTADYTNEAAELVRRTQDIMANGGNDQIK
jgi:hypothetical protein